MGLDETMWSSWFNTYTFFPVANTVLQGKAEVVSAKEICPDGENIFPVTSYVETVTGEILVTPRTRCPP